MAQRAGSLPALLIANEIVTKTQHFPAAKTTLPPVPDLPPT
jgi:hypothetical protein